MDVAVYLKAFAGVGLFFVGINLLSDHLKNYGKPYIGKIIDRFAGSDFKAILSGALSGGVTNSAKAVTFALTGIVASGVLTVRQSLPIVVGASFGSSLLVLWVSIDFKLVELMLLGVAGMIYQFGDMKSSKRKFIAGLLLGLGLVFFGLDMLKSGAGAAKDNAAFLHFISASHGYWVMALFLGVVAAFVTQSGSTISIVAITFVNAGILDFEQTIMFVYGTNIGSGISTAMLGLGVTGRSRQLVMFHAAVKVAGAFLLAPMLYVETFLGLPFIKAFASLLTTAQGTQIGVIYIAYEVISGVALLAFFTPAAKLLNEIWPPTKEESLSQLMYINGKDGSNLDEAIFRVDREQARILQRSSRYFDSFRNDIPSAEKIDFEALYTGNNSVYKEIDDRISQLLNQHLTADQTRSLLQRHSIQEWLEAIDNNMYELIRLSEKGKDLGLPKRLLNVMLNRLRVLLDTACQSLEPEDIANAYILVEMTENRESLVSRFKPKNLVDENGNANIRGQKTLLDIIVCYEKIVWSLNKIGHTLTKDLSHDSLTPLANVINEASRRLQQLR